MTVAVALSRLSLPLSYTRTSHPMDGFTRSPHVVTHVELDDVLVPGHDVAMRKGIEEGAPESLVLPSDEWLILEHESGLGRRNILRHRTR